MQLIFFLLLLSGLDRRWPITSHFFSLHRAVFLIILNSLVSLLCFTPPFLPLLHIIAALHTWVQTRNGLTETWCFCFFLPDVNECWRYPGRLCAQTCVNTPGSYECSCTSGFRLSGDSKNCEGVFVLMSAGMGVCAGWCMFLSSCVWKYAWRCVCVCEDIRLV